MKLCRGKRRGFSKSSSGIQAGAGALVAVRIRKDRLWPAALAAAALSRCFTRRTVSCPPQARVKFGCFAAKPWVLGREADGYLSGLVYRAIVLLRVASLSRVGRWPLRPVLKHGPRSLTCVRVIEFSKLKGAVKAKDF